MGSNLSKIEQNNAEIVALAAQKLTNGVFQYSEFDSRPKVKPEGYTKDIM